MAVDPQPPRSPKQFRQRHLAQPEGGKTTAMVDVHGGVVEYLEGTDDVDDPVKRSAPDREKDEARRWGDIRRQVARAIRNIDEAAQRSPLASPDWLATPTGNSPRPSMLSASRLQALNAMGALRKDMPRDCMAIIDAEILNDAFGFLPRPVPKDREKAEASVALRAMEDMRRSLDFAAYILHGGREVTWDRLMARWPEVRRGVLRKAIEEARFGVVPPENIGK
jgi:hypothetical protein